MSGDIAAVVRLAGVRLTATGRRTPRGPRAMATERAGRVPALPVRSLAEATGTSADVVVLAAFTAVLARYTGQQDIVIAVSGDGGKPPRLVGFEVPADGSFRTLVRLAAERVAAPGDGTVVEAHDAPVAFDMVEPTGPEPETGRGHELSLRVVGADRLTFQLRYDSALFTPAAVRRLLGHLDILLRGGLDDGDRPVCQLPLLSDQETRLMLVTWNDTRVDRSLPARTVDGCFTRQARDRPDDVAVVHEGTTVTFAEVERSANRLARHLRTLGVGRGDKVGLCLHRSPGFLVAALAVMKAGAAYVPLDPAYPKLRLQAMLHDARCAALVSSTDLAGALDAPQAPVVLLDEHEAVIARQDGAAAPDYGVGPDDLCYVIYTSGSTGQPKGIELRHGGVLNNLVDLNTRFRVGPGDGVLSLSSPSFDMSVYEFLGVTIAGGRVVVPNQARVQDPSHWLDLFARHRLTLWNSAPSLLELAVTQAERAGADLSRLRLVLAGGDWIPVSLPDRLRVHAPDVRFVSLGGATESSIHSTIYEVSQANPGWVSIPYGRPMANQRVYVLDPARRPVPIGVPGELHLAGDGLARGYVGDSGLTSARFSEWTYGPVTGERLYRTGDLARYGEDGLLELLGRIDFQVKIHGVRIETGEVEAALLTHPATHACAVTAHGDTEAGRQLVAYVVPVAGHPPVLDSLLDELRAHATALLPVSMVPAVFVVLDALPLSPNGKVDRAALLALAPDRAGSRDEADGPCGPWERLVAEVWQELLGIERIGRDTSFFVVGGDSFVAMRAVQQIDPQLPVAELYASPTVRGLAARLQARADASAGHHLEHEGGPAAEAFTETVRDGGVGTAHVGQADAFEI